MGELTPYLFLSPFLITVENAIVPTGPATIIKSATVSLKGTLKAWESTTKKVATTIAIKPSPMSTLDVFLWKQSFREESAPIIRENMVKYRMYSFIISLIEVYLKNNNINNFIL